MKIVCTNTDNCSAVTDYEGVDPSLHCTICEFCGSIAFLYTNEKKSIYKKNFIKPEIEEIILKALLKLKIEENNEPTKK